MMNKSYSKIIPILIILVLLLLVSGAQVVRAEFGQNWTGQFWNCMDLGASCSLQAVALFPNGINANWGTGAPTDGLGAPIPGMNIDGFSARFTSTQTFQSQSYDFVITVNDGVRLYIDGAVVLDQFTASGTNTFTVTRPMTAGSHTLIVEYVEVSGEALIQVQWFVTGTAPPTPGPPTAAPLATAEVVSVTGLSFRTGPYLGASMIGVLRPNITYAVSAKNSSEGIFTWYQLTSPNHNNQVGWASGRYLSISGNRDAIPEVGTIFDQIDGAPDIGVVGTTRAVMNFRVRPSVRVARNAAIPQIGWGENVAIIGRTVQGGRDFWYHVRYNGQVGWIFAPYVTLSGLRDAVPVR